MTIKTFKKYLYTFNKEKALSRLLIVINDLNVKDDLKNILSFYCLLRLYKVSTKISYLEEATILSTHIDPHWFPKWFENKFQSITNKNAVMLSCKAALLMPSDLVLSLSFAREAYKHLNKTKTRVHKVFASIEIGFIFMFAGNDYETKIGYSIIKNFRHTTYYQYAKDKYNKILALYYAITSRRPKYCLRYLDEKNDLIFSMFIKGIYCFRIKNYKDSEQYLFEFISNFDGSNETENEVGGGIISSRQFLSISSYFLGISILNGLVDEPSEINGVRTLESSLSLGYPPAAFQLGEYFYKKHDFKNAKFYFKKGEELNETRCMMRLAYLIYNYETTDYIEPVRILKRAAKDLGDPRAFYELGKCFYYQSITNKKNSRSNLDTARKYYEDAQKRGIKEANEMIELIDQKNQELIDEHSTSFFMKLSSIEDSEKLYKYIVSSLLAKFKNTVFQPDEEEISHFSIAIFDAVVNSKFHKDYSSPIISLDKGLSIILKERIIRKYKDYLYDNHLENEEIFFLKNVDKIHKGEIYFTFSNFEQMNHTNKESGKNNFLEFIKLKFSLDESKAKNFIYYVQKCIDKFQVIRNDAAHGYKTNLETFLQCLDILFYKDKLIQFIFKFLK